MDPNLPLEPGNGTACGIDGQNTALLVPKGFQGRLQENGTSSSGKQRLDLDIKKGFLLTYFAFFLMNQSFLLDFLLNLKTW